MRTRSELLKLPPVWAYLTLLLWLTPLLVFNNGQQSLFAYDESLYAGRAKGMLETDNWLAPQFWGDGIYHKPPGPYWLIASSFTLFGVNETAARLPAQIASIFSLLLTYQIGAILVNRSIAWLAAAILSVEFLWLQASRLATPNTTMVCLVLLGVWSLLLTELHPKYRSIWGFVTGLSFGLSFLIRSYLIVVPMVALLPYLLWEHRRHQHLFNPMLYVGWVVGTVPTVIWFWMVWQQHGAAPFEQFFGFLFRIASEQRNGNGPFFYLWNLPVKTFPWGFFSAFGLAIALRNPLPQRQLLLVGFPLMLLGEISLVSTRNSHYALILYPFVAILAAIALDWLVQLYQNPNPTQKSLPRNLSYGFGLLACLLVIAGAYLCGGLPLPVELEPEIRGYGAIALASGVGWSALPLVWLADQFHQRVFTVRYWLAAWLIGPWLALATAGVIGALGDYNPEVKAFLQQPQISTVLETHPVNVVVQETEAHTTGGEKTLILLTFYTPDWGKRFTQVSELPAQSYAWVSPEPGVGRSPSSEEIGTFRDWRLIRQDQGSSLGKAPYPPEE